MTLLLVVISLTLSISFLCSLLEAVLLSVSLASLEERRESSRGVSLLYILKKERLEDALGAILILNTISHTTGASYAGYLVGQSYPTWVGFFSAILTFLILTTSEIIPKTLGAIHSRKLSSLVGYILQLMTFLLKPVLAFTGKMTRFFGGSGGEIVSRGEVEAMIDMAGNEGTLASHEKALYRNILRLDEIRVGDVMTPRTVMVDLWENSTMQDLIAENKRGKLPSRIPIYGSTRDGITGYILLREVLTAALDKTQHKIPLTEFRREVRFVPEVATLRQALHDLTSGKDPIAMVADEHGGTCGLISTEDLFETILGIEVVDELDQVTDLRDIAKTLREKRIDRLKGERSFRAQGNDNGEK
ncbi:MAG: DUF21 domain-containing protein [Planctomycetia bacterium]|nr:DUF21 domain-containing protein [Planctomycetia bacterium]